MCVMRINISIDENLLKRIDAKCQAKNYGRSEYLRKLVRNDLFEDPPKKPLQNADYRPPKCDRCRSEAVGYYHITKQDWEQGEVGLDEHLCESHLNIWKK